MQKTRIYAGQIVVKIFPRAHDDEDCSRNLEHTCHENGNTFKLSTQRTIRNKDNMRSKRVPTSLLIQLNGVSGFMGMIDSSASNDNFRSLKLTELAAMDS